MYCFACSAHLFFFVLFAVSQYHWQTFFWFIQKGVKSEQTGWCQLCSLWRWWGEPHCAILSCRKRPEQSSQVTLSLTLAHYSLRYEITPLHSVPFLVTHLPLFHHFVLLTPSSHSIPSIHSLIHRPTLNIPHPTHNTHTPSNVSCLGTTVFPFKKSPQTAHGRKQTIR